MKPHHLNRMNRMNGTNRTSRTSRVDRTSSRTRTKKLVCALAVPLLAVPFLAACDSGAGSAGKSGGSSHSSSSSTGYGNSSSGKSSSSKKGSAGSAALRTVGSSLGKIVVDGKGMTVYYFDKDKSGAGKSVCKGECAAEWPPVDARGGTPQTEGVTGTVKTVKGVDGGKQLTVDGRPVYTFADDAKPGDVKGQGEDGVWHVIAPSGREVMTKAK